ncbi:MAG: 2-hydroxyacid dehydrogenase [Geminicoccaceae bacterium]
MRIIVYSARAYDRDVMREANAGLGHELVFVEDQLTPDTVRIVEGGAGVSVFVNDAVDARMLEMLAERGTRILVTRSMGVNHIDKAAATLLGIEVHNVPAYSPNSVSEFTVGLILTLTRKIHRAYVRCRDQDFGLTGLVGVQLSDRTVGVVGAGQIGGLVLKALSGFGCRLVYFDQMDRPELEGIAKRVDIGTLARESDIISFHVPLTPDTHHLVNAQTVPFLKRGVMLVNTGRGALIDSTALIEGLKAGHIAGAALDVYEDEAGVFYTDRSEQPLQDDVLARLMSFPNVIVTSHMAYLTDHALRDIADTTLRAFTAFEKKVA